MTVKNRSDLKTDKNNTFFDNAAGSITAASHRLFLEDYLDSVPLLLEANEYSKQQNFAATVLADAANIAWDLDDNQTSSLTIGGNRTLDNPTNMKNGATYILKITQDGTGGRTLAYGNAYLFPNGTAPVLSTAAGAVDVLTFYSDGTNMLGVIQKDFS